MGDFIEKAKKIEVVRFIIGLVLIVYPFLALAMSQLPMNIIPIAIIGTPLLYGIIPLIVAGVYFIAVSKIKWKTDTLAVILAVVGIFISSSVISSFNIGSSSISGSISFQVIILDENGSPLSGVEVDIAETPGPPPEGGIMTTDENGVAHFSLKPGNYYVFFNTVNFPSQYYQPAPSQINVSEGGVNIKEIILSRK